ncbi:hypothetical protein MMC25_003545 [Agyrium rufum]|nr:hypothetical protein [Agyrium rufum]
MLPETLSSGYKRYKDDTQALLTWLTNTARQCGLLASKGEMSPPTGRPSDKQDAHPGQGRAKGKARKRSAQARIENPETTKLTANPSHTPITYKLTVEDILDLAKKVTCITTRTVQFPVNVQRKTLRAIAIRKRFATWHAEQFASDSTSNQGHRHFIETLEAVLNILKPIFSFPKNGYKPGAEVDTLVTVDGLRNRYQSLHIDDASESDGESQPSAKPDASATSQSKPTSVILEDHSSKDEELALEIYCLYHDMHTFEDFVTETWSMVSSAKLDLTTAAVVTNSAIHLVEKLTVSVEAKLGQIVDSEYGPASPWCGLVAHLLQVNADWKERDIKTSRTPISPLGQFLYLPTGRVLENFGRAVAKDPKYPVTVPRISSVMFRECPEVLGFPDLQAWLSEERYLTALLTELTGYDTLRKVLTTQLQNGLRVLLPLDEATRILLDLKSAEDVKTITVFVARVVLQIRHVYHSSNPKTAWEQLRDLAWKTIDRLYSSNCDRLEESLNLLSPLRNWYLNPKIPLARKEFIEHNLQILWIYPGIDEESLRKVFLLFSYAPVGSGKVPWSWEEF